MILDNDILHVEISEKGAEIVSLSKHGVQYLWNADANYWNRHAPILFPIVGRLCENKYRWGGREYPMNQHGFARDSRFAPTGNRGEMRLVEKPSKDVYPFDFDLSVCYELEGNRVKALWKVVNTDDQEMCFQIGAHPGFMLPQYDENEMIHGYLRFYDKKGNRIDPQEHSSLEDGLRVHRAVPQTLSEDGELAIMGLTFRHGAIIYENGQVAAVELLDQNRNKILSVQCDQAEAFGIWAPYKMGCPFVCIEPWCGIADRKDFTGDISQRDYIHKLQPGGTFEFGYSITIG